MWGAKNIYKRTYSLPIEYKRPYNARGRFIIVNMFRFDPKLATPWKKGLLKEYSASTDCADDCAAKSYRKRLDALIAGAMGPEEDTTATMVQNTDRGIDAETPKVESSLPPHKMDVFDGSTAKSRKQRRRRSRGKPLSNYSDIAVARKLKRSSVSIRTEFPCASAIVTARERIKFKDGRPNNYQMCR